MTLNDFKAILLTADATATHYKSAKNGNYTCWYEYGESPTSADNRRKYVKQLIRVDRYTKIEFDPIVDLIKEALDRDDIDFDYTCAFDEDSGYIHHAFDCKVL